MRSIMSVQDGADMLTKRCADRLSASLVTGDVAFLLGVSNATVKRWADMGKLPSTRVGRGSHRHFRLADVVAFSQSVTPEREQSTPPQPQEPPEQEAVNA